MFIDYELHPAKDTAVSITLLGKVLNQKARAGEYTAFYQQRFASIQQTINSIKSNPWYLSSLLPVIATTAILLMAIMAGVNW